MNESSSEVEGATVAAVRSDLTFSPSPPPNPPVQVPIYDALFRLSKVVCRVSQHTAHQALPVVHSNSRAMFADA